MFKMLFILISLLPTLVWSQSADAENEQAFITAAEQVSDADLRSLPALIEKLAETGDPRVHVLLSALLNGELNATTSGALVRLYSEGRSQLSFDILSGETTDALAAADYKRIRTNNRIRSDVRLLLAQLDLSHSDTAIRLAAARRLLDAPASVPTERLQQLAEKEADGNVRDMLQLVIALQTFASGEKTRMLEALDIMAGSLEPSIRNTISAAISRYEGNDAEYLGQLQKALDKIDQKRKFYGYMENLFFGLSLGSVLLLAAIGLAITFGVMGVINMAHGEMIMLGAYTTYVIQQTFPSLIQYSLLIAVPAAFLVSGSAGVLIERSVIRFLKGRPLETLLATFGISLILQQLVRTVFSPLNRQVIAPDWMSGSWQINPVFSLTYNRLYIILFSLMVFFALLLILKKTSLGLHVRAVSQNRDMARALSIKSSWVDAATFGLGSGIAGVAGVVLSQLTNVGPNLGQSYIIDSFLVVVFGGVGNLWGTLVAAMSLGALNKLLEPVTGAVLASIIVLVALILFIQKRPKGLFPQKGRAAE